MRSRFLVLATVAGLSLASLAGAASAATTITTTIHCFGAYPYDHTYTSMVGQLAPGVSLPYTNSYTFLVNGQPETCEVTVTAS